MAKTLTTTTDELARAVLSTASANDLPDSAFAYIESGGEKDEEGKTKPRSLRHLPYKNADGKVDPAHVRNALARLSQTQISESAKASAHKKLVAAAKSVGIEASDDDNDKERSMGAKHNEALTRAVADDHEPMTTTHEHAHPAFGSQGDDESHTHSHTHDNDNDHKHQHEDTAERTADGTINAVAGGFSLSFPIVRSDPKTWAVFGRATAEVPDRHGTIFSYEGAKGAFERWPGNVREQHDGKRAVGHRIKHTFSDDEKGVYLEARISKTRADTWERVQENILNDFSVSVIPGEKYGLDPRKWPKKEYNGRMYPYLPEYDYAEISLVDAGSAPGSNFTPIMRADGSFTEELAEVEEEPPVVTPPQPLERAGARVSAETKSAMHGGIGHALRSAVSQMKNCNCPDCQAAMKMIDPDGDGDIDMGGYDDPDQDWQSLYGGSDDTERALSGLIERVLEARLLPVYARLQGIAGALARSYAAPTETSLNTLISGAITRAVEAVSVEQKSSLDEVRAGLSAVKGQVERIAETPVPGAPIMNAGAMPRPALNKRLPTDPTPDPYARPQRTGSAVADAMRTLSEQGWLNSEQRQVDALAAGLLLQQQGRG